jgi:ABC-type antimicrobial peptide transport system, permease component
MLNHLFKLIWNKKKQHFLVLLEVFVSFCVLFAVFSMLILRYHNYQKPRGFSYENVWVVNIFPEDRGRNWLASDSMISYHQAIQESLNGFPSVKNASFSSFNTPFALGMATSPVTYNGNQQMANFYKTDDNYAKTLDLKLIEGRWYNKLDDGMKETPVVLNESLKEKLFKDQPATGKILLSGPENKDRFRIVGVVTDFKDKSDFESPDNGFFSRMSDSERLQASTILVKMNDGSSADIESKLHKILSGSAKNASVQISHLSDLKKTKNRIIAVPVIILMVVCGFLIFNVGLGLFGILWYNINKRKSEIGLRRAVGATEKRISIQLIGEAMVMSTLAILIGLFFAVQFPLLNVFNLPAGIYMESIVISIAFIYLLVLICAFYPGRQAAAIQPAVVLHED